MPMGTASACWQGTPGVGMLGVLRTDMAAVAMWVVREVRRGSRLWLARPPIKH